MINRMKVRLKLFAYLRETLGFKEKQLTVDEGTTIGDLWEQFRKQLPANKNFRVLFAVNGEYVEKEKELKDGDEAAFIPPVSGG